MLDAFPFLTLLVLLGAAGIGRRIWRLPASHDW